ncbi:MAG: hypothetical protein K5905_10990 [Roseibium sp.]|uniref:hypothetical protein n=1 Tax=Roseibium sp. TaxID=1936156 RepID=UPI0026395E7D|nr:hypothetical protein [Roseibium sp.]MCV0425991.1 hypothetical protein [Roseibium sp.]
MKFSSVFPVLMACLAIVTPAHAFLSDENPDSYSKIIDEQQVSSYQNSLASAGESSTGKLHAFRTTLSRKTSATGAITPSNEDLVIHAVQDRGLPQGSEYPTYVFTSTETLENPVLIHKTHAGTRLFLAEDTRGDATCLLSAEKGWADICLVDTQGSAAPDLSGLRDDFWSDLLKVFGF